ncbi:MAG: hypothetical protein J6Z34_03430 [Clostridia bacterium]|nr:hypothetical protein [Clostridia bacterium]
MGKKSAFRKFRRRLNNSKYLIAMVVPAVVFYLVFCYAPMYGILIAFKTYYPKLGIMGSPWAADGGFANFRIIFDDPEFWSVLRNTILIGAGKIIVSFI